MRLGFLLAVGLAVSHLAAAEDSLPTGQRITPDAVAGTTILKLKPDPAHPERGASGGVTLALSPDGRTLLALTSGYNDWFDAKGKLVPEQSSEHVFVYDVSQAAPVELQALAIPNSYRGLVWRPDGSGFVVSGGVDDTLILVKRSGDRFALDGEPIALGHKTGLGYKIKPLAAGLALDPSGKRALVTNYENDTVTLVDLARRKVLGELELRPGKLDAKQSGQPGGEFPVAVAFTSSTKAYVASQRDREIDVLTVGPASLTLAKRVPVAGQPNALLAARARLYVALDNTDRIATLDTARDRVVETASALGPNDLFGSLQGLRGANPNALALSRDGQTLFVSEGGINAIALMALSPVARGDKTSRDDDDDAPALPSRVAALLPTAWYPNAVALSRDGKSLYVLNGKSMAGPNPGQCREPEQPRTQGNILCDRDNDYVLQLQTSSLASVPLPDATGLAAATRQVAANLGLGQTLAEDDALMAALHSRIRHVIYIIKENRGYDQVLGDLPGANGDPRLTLFPEPVTPNHHALARGFVTLDNFLDSGEVSGVGWNWSTAARTTDFTEKTQVVNYADRGLSYDYEGANRNLNMAVPPEKRGRTPGAKSDPNLLPGSADIAAPDAALTPGSDGRPGAGYLWDGALRAGLSLRNYGFFVDLALYKDGVAGAQRWSKTPFADGLIQATPTNVALAPVTDLYYRGFDQSHADFWRLKEWRREFDQYAQTDTLPDLTLLRLAHDHFGNFDKAEDGVNTPELQIADNDYALGQVVETIATSRYKSDTLIFVVEDDAQDAADHVDAHRSIAFVIGPYVKQGRIVSTRYTTVSLLRTLEGALGLKPLGLNDALARPMGELFDLGQTDWSYKSTVPDLLRTTQLPIDGEKHGKLDGPCRLASTHDAAWWAKAMRGQDFSVEDKLDTARFNKALWRGLKGDASTRPAAASEARSFYKLPPSCL